MPFYENKTWKIIFVKHSEIVILLAKQFLPGLKLNCPDNNMFSTKSFTIYTWEEGKHFERVSRKT